VESVDEATVKISLNGSVSRLASAKEAEGEIVECGNLSKGGFSFRSRKAYMVGSAIDVARPYYPGTQPAFVPALIRHALVLPNDSFHLRRHCTRREIAF
jgi:hypothetical protein